MPPRDLGPLIAALDLDVDRIPICQACLSFVSIPLGQGEEREAKREARKMAPMIWEEGLAEPAVAAVRQARERGVPIAAEVLDELEQGGGRSAAAREIVLHLARQQEHRARAWLQARLN
jgi:hypothetical protein